MNAPTVDVLAIAGSLRKDSYNRSLLEAASSLAPAGMTIRIYQSLETVPVFNEDWEHPAPLGVTDLRRAIASSHGLLIATPEYNQSVPGVVKNMIDWLSRSEEGEGLSERPVAVTGVTTGPWGTRLAQTHLRQMLTSTQALVLARPTVFLRDAEELFDAAGTLVDERSKQWLHEFLLAFGRWISTVSPAAPTLSVGAPGRGH